MVCSKAHLRYAVRRSLCIHDPDYVSQSRQVQSCKTKLRNHFCGHFNALNMVLHILCVMGLHCEVTVFVFLVFQTFWCMYICPDVPSHAHGVNIILISCSAVRAEHHLRMFCVCGYVSDPHQRRILGYCNEEKFAELHEVLIKWLFLTYEIL